MTSPPPEIPAEDLALLDRVATRVVELRLEIPAILTLETGRPLSVIAGQTLHFFEPVVTALLPLRDYRRFATLIERREAIETLTRAIEEKADTEQRRRRAAAQERKAAKRAAHAAKAAGGAAGPAPRDRGSA